MLLSMAMKAGCGCGCLAVLLLLVLGGASLGAAWGLARMLATPALRAPETTPIDGHRGQKKMYEVLSGASREVTLTDREINAVLSRHLVDARVPLAHLVVALPGSGIVELAGQVPIARLAGPAIGSSLPAPIARRGAWIFLRAHVDVEDGITAGRELRLEVSDWALGRLRLPGWLLYAIVDEESLRILRWPVPRTVESVTVEPGRLIVRSASARSPSAAGDRR